VLTIFNKVFKIATRTTGNLLVLGIISGVSIFAASLLKATGEKFVDTITEDISSLRSDDSLPIPDIKKVA